MSTSIDNQKLKEDIAQLNAARPQFRTLMETCWRKSPLLGVSVAILNCVTGCTLEFMSYFDYRLNVDNYEELCAKFAKLQVSEVLEAPEKARLIKQVRQSLNTRVSLAIAAQQGKPDEAIRAAAEYLLQEAILKESGSKGHVN